MSQVAEFAVPLQVAWGGGLLVKVPSGGYTLYAGRNRLRRGETRRAEKEPTNISKSQNPANRIDSDPASPMSLFP